MRIEMASDVERRLRTALREAGKREIGGMLFAEQLAPDRFLIVDFSLDADSGTQSCFRRDPQLHQKTLNDFFQRTGHNFQRFNYLGEWHSHPSFSVRPSLLDVGTMTDMVETKDSSITFAIMLIVRIRYRFWLDHSLTLFVRRCAPILTRVSRRIVWM